MTKSVKSFIRQHTRLFCGNHLYFPLPRWEGTEGRVIETICPYHLKYPSLSEVLAKELTYLPFIGHPLLTPLPSRERVFYYPHKTDGPNLRTSYLIG